jgi:aerobic carbon-monoxide dehydrogenase medium subunit
MPPSVAFVQPRSIEQALGALEHYGEDARLVAGATALSIMLRQRLIHPNALISIAGLPNLDRIEIADGYVRIGALTTHRAVELSRMVQTAIPVLAHVFGVVANVRVRNAATVGGVLA